MSLRELADAAGVDVGACATHAVLDDDRAAGLLGREFGRLAVENDLTWAALRPGPARFAFERADALVAFAERHGMTVTGHALVWHGETPAWLAARNWTADDLAAVLRSHVHRVTGRYGGRVDVWDVVNEAVGDDGSLRETVWLTELGESYVADAFRWAAERTDADLYYNDYGLTYDERKRERVADLLAGLLDDGVPVDGVGLQTHCVGVRPSPAQVRETVRRFRCLGLDVRVTEMDVAYRRGEQPADLDAAVAGVYREVAGAALDAGVEGVTVWGVTDDRSWINSWRDYPERYTDQPLLFDDEGAAKPAYEAVAGALRERAA